MESNKNRKVDYTFWLRVSLIMFGKYIPEIVTENRDKKINNILNGTDLSKM